MTVLKSYTLFRHRIVAATARQSFKRHASDWSASQYLKFGGERVRPVHDLLSQVPLQSPKRIVDLGCGPATSTTVLAAKYPESHLTGIDSSPDMIKKAKSTMPNIEFTTGDLSTYKSDEPTDLFFANAVYHWLPYDERPKVFKRLIDTQPSGGVFAFQVPDNLQEPSHRAMSEVAKDGPWAETLRKTRTANDAFQTPEVLYNELHPLCSSVNIWRTIYQHVLENHEAIVQWVMGSGLRPFIDPLPATEREGFLDAYLKSLQESYRPLYDGKVILRYPRLFVVTVKK